MQAHDVKQDLIQWILEMKNQEMLSALWEWKEKTKREREEKFFSLSGSWQSDGDGDALVKEIYGARMDNPRDIEL